MDQQLYLKYLKEYTLEALDKAEDNVSRAADWERSLFVVLKSLGFDDLAKDAL